MFLGWILGFSWKKGKNFEFSGSQERKHKGSEEESRSGKHVDCVKRNEEELIHVWGSRLSV